MHQQRLQVTHHNVAVLDQQVLQLTSHIRIKVVNKRTP